MMYVMSKEEELSSRRREFNQLKHGSLFDLGIQRFFVVVDRTRDEIDVVELTKENCLRVVGGQAAEKSKLSFVDMGCLNLRQV